MNYHTFFPYARHCSLAQGLEAGTSPNLHIYLGQVGMWEGGGVSFSHYVTAILISINTTHTLPIALELREKKNITVSLGTLQDKHVIKHNIYSRL